jgi:signal transduction histidine kinase
MLEGAAPRVVRDGAVFGAGPWELRRGAFRMSGEPHTLVVLSDVSSAVRESEREAWRRLIRVMGHEINNSLTPIRSMSEGLLAELAKPPPRTESFERDLGEALGVMARRSEGLGRFMASYAKLARLPSPRIAQVELAPLVRKVALLERRVVVEVAGGPDVTVPADVDQLEQVLINLVKNAADASLATGGAVRIAWQSMEAFVEVAIEDEGPGVGDTTNLFVPFFTTKPDGSGIGLVLCREIVEAHEGRMSLATRPEGRGAVARVRLPRSAE